MLINSSHCEWSWSIYRVIKAKCSEDSAILKEYIEQDRVYDFLDGLNPEFDQVRVQIWEKGEVPGFNEVVTIIRSEERRKSLMLETPAVENSAMIADGASTMVAEQNKGGMINVEKMRAFGVPLATILITLEKNVGSCMGSLIKETESGEKGKFLKRRWTCTYSCWDQ